MKPVQMLILSGVMQSAGCVIPFLILIRVIESTFFLNFLAYGVSVSGLFLGVIGLANYVRFQRKR